MTDKFRMDVYTREARVQITLTWRSADELRRATEFLRDKDITVTSHGSDFPFCYLETRQQLKELFDFQKSLEGSPTANVKS